MTDYGWIVPDFGKLKVTAHIISCFPEAEMMLPTARWFLSRCKFAIVVRLPG